MPPYPLSNRSRLLFWAPFPLSLRSRPYSFIALTKTVNSITGRPLATDARAFLTFWHLTIRPNNDFWQFDLAQ